MARRGPQPKNPEVRQRRNVDLVAVSGGGLDLTGQYPKRSNQHKWLSATRGSWDAFWASDVSGAVREKDIPALTRLFDLRNMHERLYRIADAELLVTGSRKQPAPNPGFAMMAKLEGEIRQLEREFGLTPDAGARMVKQAAGAESSVRDLLKAGDDDDRPKIVAVDSDTGT